MQCLLVGNYGVGNLGDEALREYFLATFPDVTWYVLSAHPRDGEYPRLPAGVRSLLTTQWWKTIRVVRRSDVLIFGGGTLFTDTESVFACLLWWWHAFIARILGPKKIILAFQGIGPFRTQLGEWCARWVCHRAGLIIVRDALSRGRVDNWNLNTKIVHSFDPALSLIQKENLNICTKNILILIPRRNMTSAFRELARKHAVKHSWDQILILSLQSDDSVEQDSCRSLQRELGATASILPIRSLHELASHVAGASLVVAQRYHGALVALALGKEYHIAPQAHDDKLHALQSDDPDQLPRRIYEGEEALREALSAS